MNKWLLINPPTGRYIRDTRCQASVNDVFAIVERAPVDLAYIAGAITANGHECFLKDYPAEGKNWDDVIRDIEYYKVNYVVINTTMFSYEDDLKLCEICKEIDPNIVTIAKGAIFFVEPEKIMNQYSKLDIAVARDEEKAFGELSSSTKELDKVMNIAYRKENTIHVNSRYITPEFELPMPKLELIKHELYVRPDTNEKQATIVVGRGCPGKCIYCVAPVIGGSKARYRTIASVLKEIKIYYSKYRIRNFYFSADNFICNRKWVHEFCEAINGLDFKISWLCTARADGVSEELISIMKQAGCWGVSIGIESGSEKIQKYIKKNLTKKIIVDAINICKKNRIVTLLHFMMGFPWETEKDVNATIKLAKKLKGNIVEFYITTPFVGTELYDIVNDSRELFLNRKILHTNQVTPVMNTYYLSADKIAKLRKKAIQSIYFNPLFYINQLRYIQSFSQLQNCANFICKKVTNIVFKRN